ncbi:MAG TPA: pitrilysin family protein [bacterium]|nr:pitrilysin family protein [bacterium]
MKLTGYGMRHWAPGLALLASLVLSSPTASDLESRVTEFTLPNGLDVIVYVDSSAPIVSTNAYYKVGSYDEAVGHTGISHMLEHMTFKHTDIYKPGDFDRIVDSAGGNNNGFTTEPFTAYYEDFAKDRYDLALRIEASRMGKCVFVDSEFQSEHQVVSEERRLHDNNPGTELWEEFGAIALLVHPSRNPTIGWPFDVARYKVQDVQNWYEQHYNPANAVLVVAGDVRPADVKAKVQKYFGNLVGKPVTRADYYDAEPPQHGERSITVRKRVRIPSLMIGFHSPGVRDTAEFYAAEVAGSIAGGGRSSRLWKKLVTELGLATSVWAGNSVDHDPGLFQVGVTPKAESLIPRIEQVVQSELNRLGTEPASERELQRVRNQVLASQYFQRDDVSDMAYLLARSKILYGDWRAMEQYEPGIERVTAEQVRDFCHKYLVPDNRTTGILVSAKEAK